MELKDRLRELRKVRGITQEAAAEALGVSSQTISKWERGLRAPDISLLPRIALFYDCTIDHLFGIKITSTHISAVQDEAVQELIDSGDYSSVFTIYLDKCEARRDDFRFLLHLLRFATKNNLVNHPEMPRILPLVDYCERYCPDTDLLYNIIGHALIIAAKSSVPILHTKTKTYFQLLPSQKFSRENFIHLLIEGTELTNELKKTIRYHFAHALSFLHFLAEDAKKSDEQLYLHHILSEIYEILSEGKFCGVYDGIYLNSCHKMAWKNMQLGNEKAAQDCIDTIIGHLRLHLDKESRRDASAFFDIPSGGEDTTALKLLRRMERHPDLAPFRERITAFRNEYETGIQAFKKDNP
ncbi:MAG: helix-turn-helix transcriptional regulator [Clostridia bacterium]|nr:helix-turn-helix transcriptional regulator [Clostridia bacterium]